MKLKVRDQLHISALGPDTMAKGAEFEVSDDVGKDLVKRGLADRLDEPTASAKKAEATAVEEPAEKAEAAPQNKAITAAPANKATTKGKAKRT